MAREDGRGLDELRPVTIKRHYIKHAEGSVLVATGDTRIICTASVINQLSLIHISEPTRPY